jgi:hypothetical protein
MIPARKTAQGQARPDRIVEPHRVKLGQLLPTLPERLTLARGRDLSHAEFLELILSDEVTRRDATSAQRRAYAAV